MSFGLTHRVTCKHPGKLLHPSQIPGCPSGTAHAELEAYQNYLSFFETISPPP